MKYQVLDLGSHEVLAQFRSERDASNWALTISAYGPAVQVVPVKQGNDLRAENAMLRDAWLSAVKLAGEFSRQLREEDNLPYYDEKGVLRYAMRRSM